MAGMESRCERWARRAGFVLGLSLVGLALLAWRIPPGSGTLGGADLIFSSGPTGELAVSPAGPFVTATGMKPSGRAAKGRLEVTNQTGGRVAVRVRALPDAHDLDELLQVEITAGPDTVFRGRLGELRRWTAKPLRLASGEARSLEFRVWLPAGIRRGYEARVDSVPLELRARPEEA